MTLGDSKKDIKVLVDRCLFVLFLAVEFVVTYRLFANQAVYSLEEGSGGIYHSDMAAYIRFMMGTEKEFNYPYPVMFSLGKLFMFFGASPTSAIALATAIFNSAAIVITKAVLEKYTEAEGIIVTAGTYALFFASMIYLRPMPKLGITWSYLGVFSPTPWHNATTLAARPFTIVSFVLAAILFDRYDRKTIKENESLFLLFSVFMLLATMTKPSYTIVHMAAAGIVMIYRFFAAKCKNLKETSVLGLCYLPTIIDLLYQFSGVFGGESTVDANRLATGLTDSMTAEMAMQKGIGIGFFTVWSQYSHNIPFAIIQAMAFPIIVLIFHYRDIRKDTGYRFAWEIYAAGFVMAAFIYEKGFRIYDFNFSWGYMCGMFIVFLASIKKILEDMNLTEKCRETVDLPGTAKDKEMLKHTYMMLAAEWGILALHLICGMRYFLHIFAGGDYY